MRLTIPHQFSKFEAAKRVREALLKARPQMREHISNFEERWEGDMLHFSFNLQGKGITGTLEITEKEYLINATLPLRWRLFEGKLKRAGNSFSLKVKRKVEHI